MLTYRHLPIEEWDRLTDFLAPIALREGWPSIPTPPMAEAAVAEDESGRIVGVLFLILAFHLEPLAIAHDSPEPVSASRLKEVVDRVLLAESPGVMYYSLVRDTPEAKAVVERNGMQPLLDVIPYVGVSKGVEAGSVDSTD